MDGLAGFWAQSDAIGRTVAALLLLMSIGAWVVILWKVWVLRRARRGLAEGIAAFWEAPDLAQARERAAALDPEGLLRPLIDAAAASAPAGTLQDRAQPGDQLTRRLRDALHRTLAHLQTGQVFLASVGSTAPFIGLFGTVWGIYHALLGLGTGGAISIERIAGPVGEALVMTAAGLAVAIPAVLAYNLFGKWVGACEAELEGFAHDLRGLALAA
ncbi:MotA/TolQ/ExbB proton channel family protein [Ideonella alba]|uniref:Biopolymer transport protein ExbB n=1 Tax=Ideonella alba TaxID=2824118 RepID=A0A940YHV9_9BURK|nr:MotA/TolQ/ExbB proton channel family protein [Ideonella alba]MBQ0930194.1 MotA/TolQ/ExbB proton channel family protein [Ideonella alba]